MTTIRTGRHEGAPEGWAPPSTCDVCGGEVESGACWRGVREVTLCAHCAVDENPLAALLADAIISRNPSRAQDALRDFERKFWRAVSLALVR
jgi:hypothetical protein